MKIEYYLETTLLKFLKSESIDSIHVIDLIKEIGICKGTFYKYYQDKYNLLIKTFQDFFYDDIVDGVTGWENFTDRSLNSFKTNPVIFLNAFTSQDVNSLRCFHEDLMVKYFTQDARETEGGEYYTFAVKVFAHCATDIIIDWLKNKCAEPNAKLIERINSVMPVTLCGAWRRGGENDVSRKEATA